MYSIIDSSTDLDIDKFSFKKEKDKNGIWKTLKYKIIYNDDNSNISDTLFIGFGKIINFDNINKKVTISIDKTSTVNIFSKLNTIFNINFSNEINFAFDDTFIYDRIHFLIDTNISFMFRFVLCTENNQDKPIDYIPMINYISISKSLDISFKYLNLYKLLKKKRMIEYRFHPEIFLPVYLKEIEKDELLYKITKKY